MINILEALGLRLWWHWRSGRTSPGMRRFFGSGRLREPHWYAWCEGFGYIDVGWDDESRELVRITAARGLNLTIPQAELPAPPRLLDALVIVERFIRTWTGRRIARSDGRPP